MKTHLRIIGDVHGHKERYLRLCRKARYTIQLGDHDFDYGHLSNVSSSNHKFFGGNHDNYDQIAESPHCLGDYGVYEIPNFGSVFFVRGAFSVDQWKRKEGVDWWRDEELGMAQCYAALECYEAAKPSFVVTHTCPLDVTPHLIYPHAVQQTKTGQLLNRMFSVHQPKTWVFGHYHKSWKQTIDGTEFIC